ncbi:chitin deacetylase-like protein 1 [Elysia marginata]|uniref:Chitin deacetylase-like protein 1 n=1 Tax=Elysia marginata TaxID=1093978 RepID=A0AAV4FNQ2_9GAST|nr:chitin deacetylase-like protein 1 [Elysia marginata]
MEVTKIFFQILLIVLALWDSSSGQHEDAGDFDYAYYDEYYQESCKHQDFYCDKHDPSVFYRCIDGIHYTFHCPSTLHFSVTTQTCDWPHSADCAGHYHEAGPPHYGNSGSEESIESEAPAADAAAAAVSVEDAHKGHYDNLAPPSHLQQDHAAIHADASDTWISQAAASGNSWWRPRGGLDPGKWQDVASIKKPKFTPHVPDDEDSAEKSNSVVVHKTKSGKVTAPKKVVGAAGKRRKSKKRGRTGGAVSHSRIQETASADRRRSSDLHSGNSDCDPSSCRLPDCFCPGRVIPHGLPASSTPQMVMLTFDDEVSPTFYGFYNRLFRPGRYNPNGCPVN